MIQLSSIATMPPMANVMDKPRERRRAQLRSWMKAVIEVKGSALKWAEEAGTSPSNITRFLRDDDAAMPTFETMAKLSAATDIPPPILGAPVNDQVRSMTESFQYAPSEIGTGSTGIAEYDIRAHAGGAAAIEQEQAVGQWRFPTEWLRLEVGNISDLVIVTVEGDSMAGTLEPGDKVVVDTTRRAPSPSGVFVFNDGLGLVVKRLDLIKGSNPPMLRIISDNARYLPSECRLDEITIVGRVRGRWQRL